VVVTATLGRAGNIVYPGKSFSLSDPDKLGDWIEELKEFGAQGKPEGQPLWGLSELEFEKLHRELNGRVEQSTAGKSLLEAIKSLELTATYPVEVSEEVRDALERRGKAAVVENDVSGLAKGTALALMLREFGLTFAPERQPNESISLRIDTIDRMPKAWPIGWDPQSLKLNRLQLARELYVPTVLEVDQMTMTAMLEKLEEKTEIPVFVDGLALKSAQVDFDRVIVQFPRKRSSWSLCLRTLVSKLHLTQELRVDENNQPFVWITKFEAKPRGGE